MSIVHVEDTYLHWQLNIVILVMTNFVCQPIKAGIGLETLLQRSAADRESIKKYPAEVQRPNQAISRGRWRSLGSNTPIPLTPGTDPASATAYGHSAIYVKDITT